MGRERILRLQDRSGLAELFHVDNIQQSKMRKSRVNLISLLQRDLTWAYQEIVVEAFVVLWVACQLSVTFATRILPNWRPTRADPRKRTDFDSVLNYLEYNVNGCFWDRVASYWQEVYEDTQNPSILNIRFGFVGTCLILCSTATLCLWFCCYLFANRHWCLALYESYHLPFCPAISRFFDFAYNDSPCVINEVSESEGRCVADAWVATVKVVLPSESPSVPQIEQRPALFTIKSIPHRLQGPLKLVCMLIAAGPLFYLAIIIWLFFSTILLWLVGLVARTIAMHYGEVAIFPCCVIFITVCSMYCCGRISGLWMCESYLWALWNKIRWLYGCQPHPTDPEKSDATSCESDSDESGTDLLRTLEVWLGLLSYLSGYVSHPVSAVISCAANSSLDIQVLKPAVAMVSY
ncbi:uncharacterized protein LOC129592290 isoform X2 [Paramacrobiotus metropolitanus]|uniref:uncharacterized protein LOC129592290 isoform X2 n=1 Tax=Paramacrobiotus metropolitanus TaxID=2943436 RepID=UPI002445B3C4|nr:uncharacterized protein LOC129592290 isoform X2 [Paramacrobiotus metropolitanus]